MSDTPPTRSAYLERLGERQVAREGFAFLDEKRLLLAAEALRQLDRFEGLLQKFLACHAEAAPALAEALARHGLEGLCCQPPATPPAGPAVAMRPFLGIPLATATWGVDAGAVPPAAVNPSPEARRGRELYARLVALAAPLAAAHGNLHRLAAEHRRAARRARALEDVILPELEQEVRDLTSHLEALDQEEAIRAWHRP